MFVFLLILTFSPTIMMIWGITARLDDIWRTLILIFLVPLIYQSFFKILNRIFMARPVLASGLPFIVLLVLTFLTQVLLYVIVLKCFYILSQ